MMKNGNTNWNLYKTFIAVFQEKNMTKASKLLGISRVAVGQNIRELGNQLGVTLFTSTHKGVEPTSNANELYPSIKNAVSIIQNIETNIQPDNKTKSLKIAIADTTASFYIKQYIKDFYINYPDVKLELFKREGLDTAKQKNLDIIIDLDRRMKENDLKTITLFPITTTFIASKDFLKKSGLTDSIPFKDLSKQPIIAIDESWEYFTKQMNFSASKLTKSPSIDMTFSMVQSHLGIGHFAKELLNFYKDPDIIELSFKDLPSPFPSVNVVCGYYKSPSRLAKAFIDGLVKTIGAT